MWPLLSTQIFDLLDIYIYVCLVSFTNPLAVRATCHMFSLPLRRSHVSRSRFASTSPSFSSTNLLVRYHTIITIISIMVIVIEKLNKYMIISPTLLCGLEDPRSDSSVVILQILALQLNKNHENHESCCASEQKS